MDIAIPFLSMSGNTKLIAEKIGEEFESQGHNVDLMDLMLDGKTLDEDHLKEFDMVGFGTFTTGYLPFGYFTGLVNELRGFEGKAVFGFNTYGAKSGATSKVLSNAIKNTGGNFLGAASFTASDDVQPIFYQGKYFNHDKPNEEEFSKVRAFVQTLLGNYTRMERGEKFKGTWERGGLFTAMASRLFKPKVVSFLMGVQIDPEKCNNCEWCVRVCPSLSLEVENGNTPPTILSTCSGCGLCEKGCPSRAVTFKHMNLLNGITKVWTSTVYRNVPRKKLTDEEVRTLFETRYKIMKHRKDIGKKSREAIKVADVEADQIDEVGPVQTIPPTPVGTD